MALYSLRWKSVNRNERVGVKEKNGRSVDLREKQIILFPLIKFHFGMAWMPRMLSNLYHSCHNNDLNQRVWISSCLFLYKLHDKLLGENTTPVTSQPLISWWWPLLFTPTLLLKPSIRQQSKSIATAPPPKKTVHFWGGSKLNTRARKTQFFLPVCAAFDQLSSWASQGFYRLYPPLSQMRNNVLYSITL